MGPLTLLVGAVKSISKALNSVTENRGGWFRVFESWPGAWQHNVTIDYNSVLSYSPVFACITLIASDIAKLRVKLVQQDEDGIWTEVKNPAYDPVIRRPNQLQNRIQFWENWIISKLCKGNTYVLKGRDNRRVVNRLWVLDPTRVVPLISDSGDVFYDIHSDNVSGLERQVVVPAREIIHDRMNCLFHPLVGVSPIFANGLAATQGIRIQGSSAHFFANRSMPGGVITAPGAISDTAAARIKAAFDANYTGENAGKMAVLGDGLTFQPLMVTAEASQLIEQLRWTAEVVCSTFHVPPYKIGLGPMPTYNNIQALNVEYYSQCLQSLIEAAELCLDEGLEMAQGLGTEFDLDGLLRMDSVTQMAFLKEAVGASILSPNEARRRIDYKPAVGGDSPMIQQQNYSLEAIAKRDAQADPFASKPPAPAAPANDDEPDDEPQENQMRSLVLYAESRAAMAEIHRGLS